MCLTLSNAVAVLDHQDGRFPGPGYTRTRHHIGHLGPGDRWFPGPDALPHTVTDVQRRDGRIVLTDQYGNSYSHPGDAVMPTAVPDQYGNSCSHPGDAVMPTAVHDQYGNSCSHPGDAVMPTAPIPGFPRVQDRNR